jgi:hypothetical protein
MKNTKLIAIVSLLLLAASGASAQSLGDYARTARKDKPATTPKSRHFDNDNLPVNDTLSVVGPPQPASVAGDAGKGTDSKAAGAKTAEAKSGDAKAADPKAAADKQKAAEEMKKKIDQQQEKINSLNREIDLDQREERLRAAAYYQDAGTKLRNPAEWNKQQTQDINDAAEKQKSLDAARQQLEQMKEDARKAGIAQNDKDKDASNQNK